MTICISFADEVQCLINIIEHKNYCNWGKRVKQNNENIHHGGHIVFTDLLLNYFLEITVVLFVHLR